MDEFGVKLVVNPEYGTRNNLYSLLRAKEKLGEVICCPVTFGARKTRSEGMSCIPGTW